MTDAIEDKPALRALYGEPSERAVRKQLDRLDKLGVHIPGRRAPAAEIELPDALFSEIERAGVA